MLSFIEFCKLNNYTELEKRIFRPCTEKHNVDYSDKRYLFEENYGALEKDDRLDYLTDKIKTEIVKVIKTNNYMGNFTANTYSKYKDDNNVVLNITWIIETENVVNLNHAVCQEVRTGFYADKTKISLVFTCDRDQDKSFTKYQKLLLDYFSSDDSNVEVTHEVKHILDHIDDIYPNTKYTSHKENPTKYVWQRRELQNFIISIISELKNIKKKDPNISYKDAIHKSEMYGLVMRRLNIKYQNKVKTKLSYFWVSGDRSLNPIMGI